MNVNLSNVSATNKASTMESSNKAAAESTESKGFFEAFVDVFTGSQKSEKVNATSNTQLQAESAVADDVASQVSQAEETHNTNSTTSASEGKVSASSTDVALDDALLNDGKSNDGQGPADASDAGSLESNASKNNASENNASENKVSDSNDVKSAMGEGQALLGRIQQANQTLNDSGTAKSGTTQSGNDLPVSVESMAAKSDITEQQVNVQGDSAEIASAGSMTGSLVLNHPVQTEQSPPSSHATSIDAVELQTSGSALRSESSSDGVNSSSATDKAAQIDWNNSSAQAAHTQATLNATTQVAINGQLVTQGSDAAMLPDADLFAQGGALALPRVSLNELEVIDTKLAQGEPLSAQELDIIEGLKTGTMLADIPPQEFAQFVALPNDVKSAMAEHQAARMTASASTATQQMQNVTLQGNAQANSAQNGVTSNTDKAAMPESLTAGNQNAAAINSMSQLASTPEQNKAVKGASLAASALKSAANQQDKNEPQHGLAGQIQAAAGQQGVAAQQQARVDAAQQAQLPLQLTKELANDQVAEKVQMMMSKNLKNLDIRLDPPELGRMQIRMTMNNDIANVHFTVANSQARDLIEQTLPRLREMLAQQGMQLADSSVQQQSGGQQQRQYAASEQQGQGTSGRGFAQAGDENVDGDVNLDLNVSTKRDGISFYA
ncbi:flagellar hook-length control protein FliK [Vibrio alfacsensis]|uniref:Flagellar hook-length control protein FliK n=1 Tax=Vibrio alfacsensis TaxID=1074311 RepID=A0ABM6YSC3_9VIBR|nr:flagellar hook-length control protein FliK [Vibrio alfacsensis]AXY00585.1 flagellar hook-length control protein FliK [Vibrio alfacsensis]